MAYWRTEDNTLLNAQHTVKSLPNWVKWVGGIAVFLLLVGLIWGVVGIAIAVFFIFMFIGLLRE